MSRCHCSEVFLFLNRGEEGGHMRIVIADDHTLLAESLHMILETDGDISVVGVANNGLKAVSLCRELKPDLLLMDVKMPEMDGIEAAAIIKERNPEIKIVILTSLEESEWIVDSFAAGADSYVLKDTPPEKLVALIKCISWGYSVFSPTVMEALLDRRKFQEIQDSKIFSEEDCRILALLSEGKSNNEIAESMNYAVGTVKNRIYKIMEYTGVENRAKLVLYALKNNLV